MQYVEVPASTRTYQDVIKEHHNVWKTNDKFFVYIDSSLAAIKYIENSIHTSCRYYINKY